MDLSWQLIKTLFYLVVIIALFLVIVKFVKKQALISGSGYNLQVLEKLYFNSEQALYLVKVIDEFWVLGISAQSIDLLAKLDDLQELKKLTESSNEQQEEYWLNKLKKVFSKDG